MAESRAPAWGLLPEDLGALGYAGDPKYLFGRLQRVGTWDADGPLLARPGRELAERALDLALPEVVRALPSEDGSTRAVVRFGDGARVEAVHIPRAVKRPRVTVCLSSQVGCAMGCTFCATAKMGLERHLEAHEIVGQLLALLRRSGPSSAQTLNLVFMGMGEPLHNVENVIRALDVLCHPAGLGVAPSRITVSTAGLVSGLDRLAQLPPERLPELAVSVNASNDDTRRRLMPVDRRWPLADLHAALVRWPLAPHRKITLEYVLLAGTNDDLTSADRLAEWTKGLRALVNVIPFNAWDGAPYRRPAPERVDAFVDRLRARGCLVKVRRSRGGDARAACGTLKLDPLSLGAP